MSDRLPPYSEEAEKSVLGAALTNDLAMGEAAAMLSADDFFVRTNAEIFDAMIELYESGCPVDLVTVTEALKRRGTFETCGGMSYFAGLAAAVPSPGAVRHYGKIIRAKAALRRLIEASGRIADECYDAGLGTAEIMTHAERLYDDARRLWDDRAFTLAEPKKLAEEIRDTIDKPIKRIGTPFSWLNDMTGGLIGGNLFTIAGRTSAGKSAFALQVAKYVSTQHKTVYITLEMSAVEQGFRYIASETGIPQTALMRHSVSSLDMGALERGLTKLAGSELYFSTAGREIPEVERILRSTRPELLIIDTVNLMRGKGESERVKILGITRELKQIALREDIPIIILAQLSRRAEEKSSPDLADIKESASIEEDSDIVLLLSGVDGKQKLEDLTKNGAIFGIEPEELARLKKRGEKLILALLQKNRNGKLGSTAFTFKGGWFSFTEIGGAAKDAQISMDDKADEDDLPF